MIETIGLNMRIKKNNIIIFVITVNILGCITMFLATRVWINFILQQIMFVTFLFSPFLVSLVIRTTNKYKWVNSGIKFNFKESKKWYIFCLLIFPVMLAVNLLLSFILSGFKLGGEQLDNIPIILRTTLVLFLPMVVKNIGEEFGWRGFLEPELKSIGINSFKRHIITGAVWATWHIPVIIFTEYTTESLIIFLPRFFIGTVIYSFVFGQLRDGSNTVWTSVILHAVGNAMGNITISLSSLASNEWLGVAPQSFTFMLCWLVLARVLWVRNQKNRNRDVFL